MNKEFYSGELARVSKRIEELELLIAQTQEEIARERNYITYLSQRVETENDKFDVILSQIRPNPIAAAPINKSVVTAPVVSTSTELLLVTGGEPITRTAGETKAFAMVYAIYEGGDTGFTQPECVRLAASKQNKYVLDSQTVYNILHKQVRTGRLRRTGSKYFLTPKGIEWVRNVMGIEEVEVVMDAESMPQAVPVEQEIKSETVSLAQTLG